MPVDPSIPLSVKRARFVGPQEVISLQNLARQGELQQTQLNEMATARAEKDQLKQLVGQGVNPQGGMDPVTLANITAIDPNMGRVFSAQNETMRLRDFRRSEAKDKVSLNLGTAYVQAYDNALQQTGGNKDAAEKFARDTTLKAIDDAQRSGTFAAQGLTDVDVMGLRQIRDPETMRSVVTILGGKVERPEVKPPATRERKVGDQVIQEQWDSQTQTWKQFGGGPRFNPKPVAEVNIKAETKYAEEVGKKAATRDFGQHEAAESAVDNIEKLQLVSKQIKEGDIRTGMGAELLLNVDRFKQFVLESEERGKKISDTELIDALLGSDVFPMIKSLGIGARGLDTPAERDFLIKVMTGKITMNKATLERMTDIRLNIAKRSVEKWNKRVESGELDEYFKMTKSKKQTITLPGGKGASDRAGALTPEEQTELDALRKRFGRGG